jgi:hypothetical protein
VQESEIELASRLAVRQCPPVCSRHSSSRFIAVGQQLAFLVDVMISGRRCHKTGKFNVNVVPCSVRL